MAEPESGHISGIRSSFTEELFKHSPEGIVLLDSDGHIVDANNGFCDMFGYTRGEVIGSSIHKLIIPDDRRDEAVVFIRSIRARQVVHGETIRRRKDGTCLHVLAIGYPLRLETGAEAFAGIYRDITDRKLAEDARIRSEQRLESILQSVPSVISVVGRDGTMEYINRVLPQYEAQKVIGGSAYEFLAHEDRDVYRSALARVYETGVPEAVEVRDMTGRTWSVQFAPIGGEGSVREVIAVGSDITDALRAVEEKLSMEAQIQHAQKLESLGVMAGGIAHDFNNLLTAILGNTSLALRSVPADSPLRKQLRNIENAATHAADITGQMLTYSGKGTFAKKAVEIATLVGEMSDLLEAVVSRKARLIRDLPGGLPLIMADTGKLAQVVMNLITNAAEACDGSDGIVRISAGAAPEDDGPGRVWMSVADNGCGMDEETKARVFEPFYTTKFTGRGLGLAAVQGIVLAHGGTISVESRPGKGSTFRVDFPATSQRAAPQLRPDPSPAAGRGSGGAILVADDEPAILELAQIVLEDLGYQVLAAVNGVDAIRKFESNADAVRLAILDLTMPEMNGEEALARLHSVRPSLPVIITSGYSEADVMRRVGQGESVGYLCKPFRIDALAAAVREILADEHGPPVGGVTTPDPAM